MNISDVNLGDRHTLALIIPILAVGGGLFLGFVSIIFKGARAIVHSRHIEESRREIAAYVAEGTMSADDAAKLLDAGRKHTRWNCF